MASARLSPIRLLTLRLPLTPLPRSRPLLHPSPPPHPSLRPLRHPRQQSTTAPDPPPPTPPSTPYTFEAIRSLTAHPSPARIIIDVREPSELQQSGRIPGAYSMPITSNPDAFYLSDEEFFDRFGFEKPRVGARRRRSTGGSSTSESPYSATMKEREARSGLNAEDGVDSEGVNREAGYGKEEGGEEKGVEEVIFYCKAGVRSRAAARMAREWVGIRAGDMVGGWVEWEKNGGEVER